MPTIVGILVYAFVLVGVCEGADPEVVRSMPLYIAAFWVNIISYGCGYTAAIVTRELEE